MHKFFTEDIKDGRAYIVGDDVKHAWKVLRLKVKDKVEINDLRGREYLGEIEVIDKERVVVKIGEEVHSSNESPVKISLYQGIPKGQKMELICQKATELGLYKVVPLITERIVPNSKDEYKKLDRLKRIILEASKQSKRTMIMDLLEPIGLNDIQKEGEDLIIVPYENAIGQGIRSFEEEIKRAEKIGIVIGPEGGFEEEEIKTLEGFGAKIVTLGPRILRTETAGLVTAAILSYIRGDLGGK